MRNSLKANKLKDYKKLLHSAIMFLKTTIF